jgi:hypothetical protein
VQAHDLKAKYGQPETSSNNKLRSFGRGLADLINKRRANVKASKGRANYGLRTDNNTRPTLGKINSGSNFMGNSRTPFEFGNSTKSENHPMMIGSKGLEVGREKRVKQEPRGVTIIIKQ